MERVRPIGETPPAQRRPSLGAVALVTVAGLIAAGVVFAGAPEPVEIPPSIEDEALASVRAFEAALAGDDQAMEAFVASDWLAFELPGLELVAPWRGADDHLDAILAFYGGIANVSLGACDTAAATTGDRATTIVRCRSARIGGTVMEAMGVPDAPLDVSFSVGADGVVAFYTPMGAATSAVDYCVWAEDSLPELSAGAFDDRCFPAVTSDPSVHVEMAAAFVVAGRPGRDPADKAARLALATVDAFEGRLASGDDPAEVFDRDWSTVRFPGLVPDELTPPFPALSDFLEWSAAVYDVELGSCLPTRFYEPATQRIECPEARWGGPLPAALGLDTVAQPVSFLVTGPEISGVFGRSASSLIDAFHGLCRDLQATTPVLAAQVFSDECVPVFSADAGRTLVALANDQET
jgi:hypothetical protein